MDIGETVAFVQSMQDEGKCVLCGTPHEDPKKDEITETAPGNGNWSRKSMSGIFDSGDSKRTEIYPNGTFPPPYEYQGHHCFALSALVVNANKTSRKDKRLRLNYFLSKVEFFPNRPSNCIGLPARKSNGDYAAFWASIDAGAPLQMHGPAHDESYFNKVNRLIATMLSTLTRREYCEKKSMDEWKEQLKTTVKHAENYAFKKLAHNALAWRLHPSEQATAVRIYSAPPSEEFTVIGSKTVKRTEKGRGNTETTITFPNPQLDTGIF